MTNKPYTPANSDISAEVENAWLLDNKYSDFKHGFLLRVMVMASTLTALFAILEYFGLHDMGAVQRNFNFFYSLSSFLLIVLLHKNTVKFPLTCSLFLFLCYLGCICAVVTVVEDDFRAIWFFLTIFFAFILKGVWFGYFSTVISLITLTVIQLVFTESYSELSFITIIIALIFFSMSLASFTKQMRIYRHRLRKQSKELHYLANKDPLTDVLNQKNYYVLARSLLEQAKEKHSELSMLCIFIDNLNLIYQKFGSQIEASLLDHVEKLISEQLHLKGDIAKVSQQEICILLPEHDTLSAKALAQQINESVQKNLFSTNKGKIAVTLSIGIATLLESDNEIRSIQVRADKALSKAKALGGDRILTHSD